ncbi:Transcriptional regulator containing PAS, AAA-type ATPase, and DNA-binding Fis domains [Desulfotomaculum arcticum]|uniref:HTH-type transcriptional regulatory protein TyrR n=1 Tax=Desulfotruncus arcticus DSM 17038 TaxID=1121424 RepID=A0A1I2Y262_9FIRM|nr:sigma-54-dependent Fis family transcriptional regulator [Desulfotruncus arcticus]SFH19046.1 Transcriptional regulator containing PAS, AAA-type ATPase, and DNA-binding Fis domains [Desulfotomaculum arcticum] [Desulfotruncus arcticus DSM 17038]
MKLSQFMTGNPVTLKENCTIKEAAELFTRHSIDGAPVLDEQGEICGIFTKTHLYRAIVNDYSHDMTVGRLMKRDVKTISLESSAESAWQLAQEQQVGRLPVKDGQGNLVAMVTRTNLVQAFEQKMLDTINRLSETTELYEELNAVINSSYDGIVVLDKQGKVVQVNNAFTKMGLSINETIYALAQKAIAKKDAVTKVHRLPSGKDLLLTANPVQRDNKSKVTKVVVNCRDITELNNLRREVEAGKELYEVYHTELETLRTKYLGHTLVCESPVMRNVLDLAVRVAKVDSTILILGESGVGKDVVTRLIHKASKRSGEPFIRVNCGAIPENLLESELFGYEPGAFTGASREGKPGLLELAHQGTLFLDEIAELPLALQVKLLNVIQEREVTRLGGIKAVEVDIRLIAATNQNLEDMVKKGKFRGDLYYRLNVVPITIPPLRERSSDIPALVIHFLRKFNEKYHLNKSIAADAMDYLTGYHWPGNVRELENLIERLMVINTHDVITAKDLPIVFLQSSQTVGKAAGNQSLSSEKELIAELYQRMRSTRKVAEVMGVNQSTVVRKMKKYNIKPD